MFGLVSKKRVLEKIKFIKDTNRKYDIYADYSEPISKEQETKNIYSQGYEDGTDNFYNSIKYVLR